MFSLVLRRQNVEMCFHSPYRVRFTLNFRPDIGPATQRASSVDALIAAHDAYLDAVMRHALLAPERAPAIGAARAAVRALLGTLVRWRRQS